MSEVTNLLLAFFAFVYWAISSAWDWAIANWLGIFAIYLFYKAGANSNEISALKSQIDAFDVRYRNLENSISHIEMRTEYDHPESRPRGNNEI